MSSIWSLLQQLEVTQDPNELKMIGEDIGSRLQADWSNPHVAMEHLECAAEVLPFSLAVPLVKSVVTYWMSLPGYDWSAGGSAGHCYLSALLLTGNFELIEPQLFLKWFSNAVSKSHSLRGRTRDPEQKLAALQGCLDKIRDAIR